MDEILLSKIRLAVIGHLVNARWATFTDLKKSMDVTNGNLGSHIAKLVEAGYVKEEKRIVGRRPQSRYRLTTVGRQALLRQVQELEEIAGAIER